MRLLYTASLTDGDSAFGDIQFWKGSCSDSNSDNKSSNYNNEKGNKNNDDKNKNKYKYKYKNLKSNNSKPSGYKGYFKLKAVSRIKYSSIPVYLVSGKSNFAIFTNNADTEAYFKSQIVDGKPNQSGIGDDVGLLAKLNSSKYIVFYYSMHHVKSFEIDFALLERLQKTMKNKQLQNNTFIHDPKEALPSHPSAIFEKVLQKKQQQRLGSNPFLVQNAGLKLRLLLSLSTNESITMALNKLISSGLRLRGLSLNQASSTNEKLKIKEIHQMTLKAALFSLRKYNTISNSSNAGSNNNTREGESRRKHPIQLSDLQETVETLLHLFVDLE